MHSRQLHSPTVWTAICKNTKARRPGAKRRASREPAVAPIEAKKTPISALPSD